MAFFFFFLCRWWHPFCRPSSWRHPSSCSDNNDSHLLRLYVCVFVQTLLCHKTRIMHEILRRVWWRRRSSSANQQSRSELRHQPLSPLSSSRAWRPWLCRGRFPWVSFDPRILLIPNLTNLDLRARTKKWIFPYYNTWNSIVWDELHN